MPLDSNTTTTTMSARILNTNHANSDFVTNSYGKSWDSSCEKS